MRNIRLNFAFAIWLATVIDRRTKVWPFGGGFGRWVIIFGILNIFIELPT
jgi:hypothetical protein